MDNTIKTEAIKRLEDQGDRNAEILRSRVNVPDKRTLYKTAKARIGCALFKAGEIVSVKYDGQHQFGTHWYEVKGSKNSLTTQYAEHQLTDFVL